MEPGDKASLAPFQKNKIKRKLSKYTKVGEASKFCTRAMRAHTLEPPYKISAYAPVPPMMGEGGGTL